MIDIYHQFGNDLIVDSTGGLALVQDTVTTTQRIYRRLVTNPGDYLWNLSYGGGLRAMVGTQADNSAIESVVRNQLALESTVAPTPVPTISSQVTDAANGIVVTNITYTDAQTDTTSQVLVDNNQ
jgi:hypothetical protein